MLDSRIKIQDYSASAWKMLRNFIVPELEETNYLFKWSLSRAAPPKTLLLLHVLTALVGGTGLPESKHCSEITLSSLLAPAVSCLAHWCDMSCSDLVTECVRSSRSSPWSFQVAPQQDFGKTCQHWGTVLLHMTGKINSRPVVKIDHPSYDLFIAVRWV